MQTYHPIEFVEFVPDNKHFKYARLRQRVEYSGSLEKLNNQLFMYDQEFREVLYQIPANNFTMNAVLKHHYPNARIFRTISHEPILSTTDMALIDNHLESIQTYMDRQIVRFKDTAVVDQYGQMVFAQNKLNLSGEFIDQDLRIPLSGVEIPSGDQDTTLAFAQ